MAVNTIVKLQFLSFIASISAYADEPHDAASRKIANTTQCERYLKHCRFLAHTYTVMPKLHLVDLL